MLEFTENLLRNWFSNKWLCWGIGPVVAANIGFFGSVLLLEGCLRTGLFDDCLITYSKTKTRHEAIKGTQLKISSMSQFQGCLWVLLGPSVLINAAASTYLLDFVHPMRENDNVYPPLMEFIINVILLLVINDFFLYWGHRIQHMVEYLWKNCHSYHHQIDTPTAVSTVYIDSLDATLQAGLPVAIAGYIVAPHPLTMYAFVFLRLADNAINHSGINSIILNALFLKYLPFRGSVGHHDAHHKFSNYTTNAKNFGEYFWLWDWLFGTLTSVSKLQELGRNHGKVDVNKSKAS